MDLFYSLHHSGRSEDGSINESEPKARTDCVGTNQSKECSVAIKTQKKTIPSVGASAAVTTASAGQKVRPGQQLQQKNTVVRRKVVPSKQKAPAKSDAPKLPQQVINRARGTLHGLSTIKRHGNVRVT